MEQLIGKATFSGQDSNHPEEQDDEQTEEKQTEETKKGENKSEKSETPVRMCSALSQILLQFSVSRYWHVIVLFRSHGVFLPVTVQCMQVKAESQQIILVYKHRLSNCVFYT